MLCTVRRRRKSSKYKEYSQVTKESIKPPEFSVKPGQHVINQQVKPRLMKDTLGLPHKKSSEESLSPLSSDDTYYDAEDKTEGRRSRSLSSREPSPTRATDGEDDDRYPDDHIGRIWFSVQYDYKKQSLELMLQKALNLPDRSATVKTCNPLVKISLLPQDKHIAQSRYKRKNKNPIFNETFYIPLPSTEVDKCTLCLTVLDGYRANQQTVIGQALLPLSELDRTKKVELEKDLTKPIEVFAFCLLFQTRGS
jgi:uncharacterized protein with von Willebrand factor type A (vWA) domain